MTQEQDTPAQRIEKRLFGYLELHRRLLEQLVGFFLDRDSPIGPSVTPEAQQVIVAQGRSSPLNTTFSILFPNQPREEQERRFLNIIASLTDDRFRISEVLSFSLDVETATQRTQRRLVTRDSKINTVAFHFPPGPSFLVDVRVLVRSGRSEVQVIPTQRGTFISLDDALLILTELGVPLNAGSEVIVEWNNFDSAFPHKVPVIITTEAV
jgi:hypothetical protein